MERVHNEISGGVFFATVVQGHDITLHLPAPVRPALSGLPAATPEFVGRETESQVLSEVLDPASPGRTAVVSAVAGLPGVGKTELAVQAVRAAQGRGWLPGGVLFVDLHGYDDERRLTPGQALDAMLRALGVPPEHIPPRPEDRTRLYVSALAACARQGRALAVVLDNAASAEQVRPLLPADGRTRAIVTSRNTLATLDARLLDLDVLDEQASVRVLAAVLRRARGTDARVTDDPQAALTVVRLCGRLPLALRIVAALLAEDPRRPLAELARDLADERARLAELEVADLSVRAAFDLSYRTLAAPVAAMFRLLALHHGPDISAEAAAVLAGTHEREARRTLEALARAHLLEHGTGRGRRRLHDLARLYAGDRLTADSTPRERELATERLVTFYLDGTRRAAAALRIESPVLRGEGLYSDFRSSPDDSTTPGFRESFRATARTALETMGVRPGRAPTDATAAPRAPQGPGILAPERRQEVTEVLGWLDAERANLLATAAHTARPERTAGSAALGDRLATLVTLVSGLAEALRWDARAAAMAAELHWQAAELHHGLGDRRAQAVHLNNSAVMDPEPGRRSAERLIRAGEIFAELGDRAGEGTVLANLGTAYHLLDRHEGAAAARRLAADAYLQAGRPNALGEQLVRRAISLRSAGRLADAVDTLGSAARVFDANRSIRGEDYALDTLAELLDVVSDPALAAPLLGTAAEIFGRAGEPGRQGRTLVNLGLALLDLGRGGEAREASERALALLDGHRWAGELGEQARRLSAGGPSAPADRWSRRHRLLGSSGG
ncbi:hypothetical protein [Streptomyces sp. CBMA156]|uniref:hypothetical protein n=1 Tax=Streptomyces sp. CBMA156 TaxID=1930280 RepID=UPI001662119B|nr:hypothetical protein [Streptomyces sp. CBMA156]MBD0672638.1 hypothetical protein [Streptomyces sp. CBMA156]